MIEFKWYNPRYVHVVAASYEHYTNESHLIQVAVTNTLGLLVGRILKQPETNDIETNNRMPEGTVVLIQAYDSDGRVFAEPVEGQQLMEEGQYAVIPRSILAIIEQEPVDPDVLDEAAPLSEGVGDHIQPMVDSVT